MVRVRAWKTSKKQREGPEKNKKNGRSWREERGSGKNKKSESRVPKPGQIRPYPATRGTRRVCPIGGWNLESLQARTCRAGGNENSPGADNSGHALRRLERDLSWRGHFRTIPETPPDGSATIFLAADISGQFRTRQPTARTRSFLARAFPDNSGHSMAVARQQR